MSDNQVDHATDTSTQATVKPAIDVTVLPEPYAQNPERYKRWANGAIYDTSIGRVVANPGGGIKKFTKDNTADMRALYDQRRLQAKLAAQGAVAKLAVSSGKPSVYRGWQLLVSAQAELAMDTDRGRASTDAARFVGQATGFLDSGAQAETGSPASMDGAISLLAGALRQFLGVVANPSTVIDGEWVSGDDNQADNE